MDFQLARFFFRTLLVRKFFKGETFCRNFFSDKYCFVCHLLCYFLIVFFFTIHFLTAIHIECFKNVGVKCPLGRQHLKLYFYQNVFACTLNLKVNLMVKFFFVFFNI